MCVIVGDVPNSGYMLRFTQEHACLRISTKPVDMPEGSPQTPQHPPQSNPQAWKDLGQLDKNKGRDRRNIHGKIIPDVLTIISPKRSTKTWISWKACSKKPLAHEISPLMYFPHNTSLCIPPQHKMHPFVQNRRRPDQNLRQKEAVYNGKISEYTHVAWKSTSINN